MSKSRYDERKVLANIARINGVEVDFGSHTIKYNRDTGTVGIHTLGKLDFLRKYCGWIVIGVSTEDIKKYIEDKVARIKEELDAKVKAKVEAKRLKEESRLNLANMTKKYIKKPKF